MKSRSPLSVLVTGASTGIGLATALELAERDHQVFASVRSLEAAEELKAMNPDLIPVRFDVTDAKAIERAKKEIAKKRDSSRPFCLVNNAGIAVPGPLEDLPIEEISHQLDVNVLGPLRVTQAFLPFIREHRGRIVNISSVAGLFAMPFLGPYAASKFALEALSDALRRELAAEGIRVLLIEPGPVLTPIWDKGLKLERERFSKRYHRPMERFERQVMSRARQAIGPERVALAIAHALESPEPPVRQVITALAGRLETQASRWLPARWMDKILVKELFRGSSRGAQPAPEPSTP